MLTADTGYWVYAEEATTIETCLVQADTGFPPVVLRPGWNLAPVLDPQQAPAGLPPGGGPLVPAVDYFASINWVAAYTYDTRQDAWIHITPSNGGSVVTGAAYWVYVLREATLVS